MFSFTIQFVLACTTDSFVISQSNQDEGLVWDWLNCQISSLVKYRQNQDQQSQWTSKCVTYLIVCIDIPVLVHIIIYLDMSTKTYNAL